MNTRLGRDLKTIAACAAGAAFVVRVEKDVATYAGPSTVCQGTAALDALSNHTDKPPIDGSLTAAEPSSADEPGRHEDTNMHRIGRCSHIAPVGINVSAALPSLRTTGAVVR